MTDFIDVRAMTGWTPRGFVKLVDNEAEEELVQELVSLGFEIYIIDGSTIVDRESLFNSLSQAFSFPDYFGGSWDGFDDCFSEFLLDRGANVAIIWRDAHLACDLALRSFLRAVVVFTHLEDSTVPNQSGKHIQIESFFLGPAKRGFHAKPGMPT